MFLCMQINVFARFFDISNGERIESQARAVCTTTVLQFYYSGDNRVIYVLLCTTIFIPLVIIFVLFLVYRSLDKGAVTALNNSKPSFVSFVLIGFYASTTIFILDIQACHAVVTSNHEFGDYVDSGSINFHLNFVTLFIDASVLLLQILCIVYIFYINIKIFFGINKRSKAYPYVLKFIVLLIGKKNSENFRQISDDAIIAAVFPFMLFIPIISFSSHCIYIVLAWLTEPEKASVIFLTLYFVVLINFYLFKSLYAKFSSVKIVYKKNKDIAAETVLEELKTTKDNGNQHSSKGIDFLEKKDSSHRYINTQAFCLTLIFSSLAAGFVMMLMAMFVIIPFESVSLIDYVINIFQIFVLILSSQFALKVIFDTGFDLYSFIGVFKEALGKKEKLKNDNVKAVVQEEKELYKVAGVITAELTSTILDLAKSPEQTE